MPKVVKTELAEVISELANIVPLIPKELASLAPDDVFFCALGFEPRCLVLPTELSGAGYRTRRCCYFRYATNLEDNAVNLEQLNDSLTAIAPDVLPMESDDSEFPNRLRAFLEVVVSEASSSPVRVTVDVSAMANRLILRGMKVLLEYDVSVRIVYSEANSYRPTKAEYERYLERSEITDLPPLEQGVSDVITSVDHPGIALDPLPDSVILFPNFWGERSSAVISFVDSSLATDADGKVVWILGVPHLDEDYWRLDAMKELNSIDDRCRQFEVSTFNYKESLRVLEDVYAEMSDWHTITVSPLGSKMQALGAAVFCYMHADVRVVFALPKEYNAADYSTGCKAFWQVDFGPFDKLRSKLDEVGTLRIEE